MNTFTRNTLALIAVSTLHVAFFAATAHAGETADLPTTRVNYADLNLDTAIGAQVLYQRLRIAAKQVCDDVDSRQLNVAAAARDCMDRAIVNGVRMVNNEQLARVAQVHGYEVRTGFTVAAR